MSQKASVEVVTLAFNESLHLPRAIKHAKVFAQEIFVIDSFSSDETVEIAEANGAHVLQHPFQNQAKQYGTTLRLERGLHSETESFRTISTHME